MTISQIFVVGFAILSGLVCISAIWKVATTPDMHHKLWCIVGSSFGFAGFATDLGQPSDIFMHFGFALPVVMVTWVEPGGHVVLKTLFPVIAVVALVKASRTRNLRTSG